MKMRLYHRVTLRVLFMMTVYFGSGEPCNADSTKKPPRCLLHLFSYHSSHTTFPQIIQGLYDVLGPAGVSFDTECLDLKRLDTYEHRQRLYEGLVYKFLQLPANHYSGIITSDDKALIFALEYQTTLFSGLPIVFCGVNNRALALKQNTNDQVTGIIEAISWQKNIEVAKQLQPDLESLYFIVEDSWTGQATRQEIERLGNTYQGVSLRLFDLNSMTWSSLALKLRQLKSNEASLIVNFARDMNGDNPEIIGGVEALYQQAVQPMYGAAVDGVGDWMIGGHLLSHRDQAVTAANTMLHILEGISISDIPVQEESPNRYIFDYRGLAHYKISLSNLPEEAVVLHLPESFLDKYHSGLLKVACVIILTSILVALLYLVRQRNMKIHNHVLSAEIEKRRKTEAKLLDYQARLKTLASEMALSEERQRRHLAGLLHDGVGQSLALTKMKLQCLHSQSDWDMIKGELDEVCDTLTFTMNDLRTLSFQLSSPILTELGLEKAVKHFLDDHVKDEHGIDVEFVDDGAPKPLHDDDREMLFRSIRELLINTIKHADASVVRVELKRKQSGIFVSVEDDGIGCDDHRLNNPNVRSGYGLFSIRERLDQRGGILAFNSRPGHGCKAVIEVPSCWVAEKSTESEFDSMTV